MPAVAEKDISASKDFVFIVGYGRVGQLVCEMLDRKCIPYVVLESSPQKAIEARNKGLPVYFGELAVCGNGMFGCQHCRGVSPKCCVCKTLF
jgi:S-adenosylhomocysteine hydrolase